MDELKDVYNHFLLYYGRDIPKMQNAAKASRKKQKRVREEGDEEGECQKSKPRRLMAMAFPRMPFSGRPWGVPSMSDAWESGKSEHHLFSPQVKVRRQKMRSREAQSSSRPPAETCIPSVRVLG